VLSLDVITGGEGSDTLIFERRPSRNNLKIITDFSQTEGDIIVLDRTFFGINSETELDIATEFATVSSDETAEISDALIVYNTENGSLFYNPNRSDPGFRSGGQFATLTDIPLLEAEDFFIR